MEDGTTLEEWLEAFRALPPDEQARIHAAFHPEAADWRPEAPEGPASPQ